MKLVDLKVKPYYLSDEDITWVENTIKEMTIEEKIGQLFINLFWSFDSDINKKIIEKYHIGGARYTGGTSEKVHELLAGLQEASKVPLLVACNCDAGGDGAISDGTYIASGAQCEASGNEKLAYNAGYVSGREATAIGCNWNFDPCADILYNWRNTIVNTRAYGTNPEDVLKYTSAYIKGLRESNIASCAKHFPGDGTEERDQHLLLGVNELSVDEWDKTFGKVYKQLIDDGLMTIMAGHIALPEYQYKLNPNLKYEDVMPATLSPELINGLLKDQLDFNGLVITDASHMIGIAAAMSRKDYVPGAIAAGCDMFLFFNENEEDFNFMLEGYKNGVITEERLQDALRRILGLKASLKLHEKQKKGTLIPDKEDLKVVGCEEHLALAKEAADLGISLIKDTKNQLPIKPSTHKRIRLHTLFGDGGFEKGGDNKVEKIIIEELERAGFEVTLNDGSTRIKGKIQDLKDNFDAAIIFADIVGYAAENNYRIRWKCPMSTDMPWYVNELPTVFVSLNFTTHLTDVPMVKTYINAYKDTREVIRQTIEKMMGESEFKGTHFNEHVWCNKWETRR
ncbi:glycoside hydrolase family 3 protein [Clostridium chromiireducens]|uniref:beta-N-acetylhexosaminidase n=1 Tax=Clostridium chromiireducens TaxID=225345 RepID=A0A1V4IR77_9CLOT|nr:glycoside hydrolase family 3 N-terminal domain-containing protein [Clostridium chromiireducens]OPJ62522.1 beta-N-acetylglucosaminidase/beta-glucosidase [Clostridium chromiireducens]